jgi:hypothetical protein
MDLGLAGVMLAAAISSTNFQLARDGAQLFRAAVGMAMVRDIIDALAGLRVDCAGTRLFDVPALRSTLDARSPVGALVASMMGDAARPVRAILFDKTPAANWSLGWHQDRVIAVRERIEVAGFGPWTRKASMIHVAPPFDLLARMTTLRLHLDPVTADNAPLLIAPGSHRLGRIAEDGMADAVARCGVFACLAAAGDAWLYATPILHASEAARVPGRRRVLQVDYAVGDLPGGLAWLGI